MNFLYLPNPDQMKQLINEMQLYNSITDGSGVKRPTSAYSAFTFTQNENYVAQAAKNYCSWLKNQNDNKAVVYHQSIIYQKYNKQCQQDIVFPGCISNSFFTSDLSDTRENSSQSIPILTRNNLHENVYLTKTFIHYLLDKRFFKLRLLSSRLNTIPERM